MPFHKFGLFYNQAQKKSSNFTAQATIDLYVIAIMEPLVEISPTQQAPPHEMLKPYISHYAFHDLSIPENPLFEKKICLKPTTSIDFFIGDPFKKNKRNARKLILRTRNIIRAPHSFKCCTPVFTGRFICFSLCFYPTGLYRLFGIPMDQLGSNSIPASNTGRLPFDEITDRMMYAPDIAHCIAVVEPYLLALALKCRTLPSVTEQAAQLIIRSNGNLSINELAVETCLSLSQLEKNFTKKVGTSPKAFANMQRIYQLMMEKTKNPETKWSALAYQFGYFDPIHLTRQFNAFMNANPSGFNPSEYILL